MTSLILDIETLSRRQNAVITEIGVIAVDRNSFQPIDRLLIHPLFFEQMLLARHLCVETIQFHQEKGTLPTSVGTHSIHDCYKHLAAFVAKHNPYRIWIQGKDFDVPKLDTLFQHIGKPLPWKYYQVKCARDAWDLAFPDDIKRDPRPHDAIGDCAATLRDTWKALATLNRISHF